ncbi:PREDICTED: hyaluronan mediated motility receptor [Gekko japonicus]|uniref:Hyaluronan mediated motility receptor n=1 Tax=Gekko japonicus TaxID=146911 RepID=A0ABM1L4V8_GEKJA|nr:PREDICTED: hyaluronan mediated motility receptor [Gekko japonicus]
MSFPKAPIKRFNEAPSRAPAPGSYDVKSSDTSKGPVSFDKSQRFTKQMGDTGSWQNPSNMKPPPSPASARKMQSLDSKATSSGVKPEKDLALLKNLRKQKELEKEIRALVGESGQQDKKIQTLEEEVAKLESKLSAAIREKTSFIATVASMEKQLLELTRTNELLKTKFSEDGTLKKMNNLCAELMKLGNRMHTKKVIFSKQEDMKMKLRTDQRTLVHSNEKVPQLEEQLIVTEIHTEEKYDSDKLLEYVAELSNAAELVDKYKLDIARLEEVIEAKNTEIETLQTSLQYTETTLSTQIKELYEKCKMFEQQKEELLIEYREKEQSSNAEIQCLKERLNLEEEECQKQKSAYKELSTAMCQKWLEFQEEVTKEKQILERELRETMDELDKLHTKEGKVQKMLKHQEEEYKSQTEELVKLQAKLQGKNTELEKMAQAHRNAIVQIKEEHSNTLCKLGENIAEFEIYKARVSEEMICLRQEKTALQDQLAEVNKAALQTAQAMQEVQRAKEKAKEEYARMLLDAQTKLALKDEEIKRIKESNIAQIANIEARLEDQKEDFKKQLELERETIAEKAEADYRENVKTWRILYEELYNKVKPFQQQLDAYEAEKNALMNEHGAAQEVLNKLSDAYAKLLGHQNQKQKIKHVMRLKEENAQMRQEVSRLRTQLAKEKQMKGDLQEQLNAVQGIKRFDPSIAFQHSTKENIDHKTPFKESNRNKS